ncbi:hypothetical protein ACF09G_32080 [Streptomyces albogriseolus]|uniref:hypothetical protein n=1 Tax=Streptomyces albogriseolus TaxID=1887 RepID=UPI0019C64350|nr:hypothetical protein [Streptomyces sp.]
MREATVTSMEAIEAAARHAALTRGEGPSSTDYGAEPSILHAPSEHAGVEAILRHRLRLPGDVRLSTYEDLNHPLFPGAQHFRATRTQLSQGRRAYFFIGTYESPWRLAFSLIAPCPDCAAPVPSVLINSQADFGDWLIGRDGTSEVPLFRTSPVHRRDCPTLARRPDVG